MFIDVPFLFCINNLFPTVFGSHIMSWYTRLVKVFRTNKRSILNRYTWWTVSFLFTKGVEGLGVRVVDEYTHERKSSNENCNSHTYLLFVHLLLVHLRTVLWIREVWKCWNQELLLKPMDIHWP